ncbi:UNVERIFIED_CONTAM: hypothetical protein FKN15_038128 [Acipenser sinensis]
MNDYAGQREVVAENMMMNICIELTKYSQDIKQERKMFLLEGRKAQHYLECSFKQLDSSKRKFEREWREAEKATLNAERLDQDINATKADVEKAKQQAHLRTHIAEECKNEYAAQLQKYNKDQNSFYFTDMPQVYNKLQDMDERRVKKLREGYHTFSETERRVMPIIGKCLDGITKAADNANEKKDALTLIELHKSGFQRPEDVEFEDYSQAINRATSESSLGTPKAPLDLRPIGKNKSKLWPFSKNKKTAFTEDFSHLPPEQRRKKLQQKIEELNKERQKEVDQREALDKMKDVYQKNPQMGDPNSLEPQISQTSNNIERLQAERQKYKTAFTEDFSHLPPEQRRKKLQQKIEELNKERQKEVDQREALDKMKDVYQKNPQMGDPNSLEPQISQTSNNIERLQAERQKYEVRCTLGASSTRLNLSCFIYLLFFVTLSFEISQLG